jgi:prepilin-type N-terminal cleavage/methylation domain-containing protein/prepilin-type processing-associated H-X9-DG protein
MKKRAFTLPELLVVLGIIAILIAILMPAVRRAREAAHQAVCMSHLRQLAQATIMYCGDNEGVFPGNGNGYGDTGQPVWSDWIYWDTTFTAAPALEDVYQSPLLKYLDSRDITVFTCPSDPGGHTRIAHPGESTYPFSYSFNTFLGNGPDYHHRTWRKIGQIKRASVVMMFVDEDERTVNDGAFLPEYNDPGIPDSIASRHDGDKTYQDDTARGNVVFVDGHGEFITRAVSRQPSSYQPFFPTILPYVEP